MHIWEGGEPDPAVPVRIPVQAFISQGKKIKQDIFVSSHLLTAGMDEAENSLLHVQQKEVQPTSQLCP